MGNEVVIFSTILLSVSYSSLSFGLLRSSSVDSLSFLHSGDLSLFPLGTNSLADDFSLISYREVSFLTLVLSSFYC